MAASNTTTTIPRTAISAGKLIAGLLNADTNVKAAVTRIFPNIAEDEAKLPYICYKRDSLTRTPAKQHTGMARPATTASYVVEVFANTYGKAVDIAELVADALDCKTATVGDLHARSITLTDGGEGWADGAYYQQLVFEVKVN